ncbi:hypothetical protein [Planomonospora sp. ID82291]|uniref:hypothetical protein n=1 Tax=Planomonospora sp. ID82291 TaxID=2738136 RepID=UPI0018C3780F|nr:hypothetical protein [Planomonospora sp. ID82291]MBG0813702.1 hypothetical protein [Planomonospora sp. ID82291]
MGERSEDFDVSAGGFGDGSGPRRGDLDKLAVGLAISESLANHGHHALANAHRSAADSHRLLAEAEAGDVGEHRRLEEWHRWCALVESQLADEADELTPTRRDREG